MNAYEKLEKHLNDYMYQRGDFKGAAPADSSNRRKTNFRVTKDTYSEPMAVRFHNTDIIKAYPNGDIVLNCNGWETAPTTRAAMNFALRWFFPYPIRMYGQKFKGLNPTCLAIGYNKRVMYYDGIRFNHEGQVLSELKPFEAQRINKEESSEFAKRVKASGFKDVFKILHATADPEIRKNNSLPWPKRVKDVVTDENMAHHWPYVVACHTFGTGYWAADKAAPERAWASLMANCKQSMYEIVPTSTHLILDTNN